MPQNLELEGGPPWGIRLKGGTEHNQPISISRVTPGSKASVANLCPGDVILAIGGVATEVMTLADAQKAITNSGHQLSLKIERPETRLWSPQLQPFRVNLEDMQQDLGHFEHKFNVRPRPFGTPSPLVSLETTDDNNNIYCDKLSISPAGPSKVRTALIKTESSTASMHSLKVRGDRDRPNGSVRRSVTRTVVAPVTKAPRPVAKLQKLPLCDLCGKGILGTVVHAGEKWRHPACFLCACCGLELKHQGYYLIDGQLYCQEHAVTTANAKPPVAREHT
ncbi:PDZ and LIM domain protein 3-like [Diretmus argenteus]